MNLEEYEQLVPNMQAEGLTWITPNQHVAWRVSSLQTKEADTYAWVNAMDPADTLIDIGANIGQYSLLAAKRGVRVHAFEPESQNFALLVRNIAINNLGSFITPWPVALSDHLSMEVLHLSSIVAGGSCHAYGEPISFTGERKDFPYRQGSISTTLDHFCARYGTPTHIKIDVDGFEHLVIAGGLETIRHCKSILIEINTNYPEHMKLVELMTTRYGFTYDDEQVLAARRTEGPFKGVGNYIFWKKEPQ